MKIKIMLAVIGCSLALSTGCQSPLKSNGMPSAKYLVGGGPAIDWRAKCDGIVYYVDATTQKIIQTKTVTQGENYEMELDLTDEEVKQTMKLIGIDLQKAKFQLYFVPDRIKSEPSNSAKTAK
jgi:hypothetical protein